MNTTQHFLEHWNDGLRLISFCPVCETKYNATEANVLAEELETRLLHVQCRKCQHSMLALVLVNEVGASSVGILTDLTYEDVLKFRTNRSVSVNDVIDVHTVLEDDSWTAIAKIRQKARSVSHKERKVG